MDRMRGWYASISGRPIVVVSLVTVAVLALTWVVALAVLAPNDDSVAQAQSGSSATTQPGVAQPTPEVGSSEVPDTSATQIPTPIAQTNGISLVSKVKTAIVHVAKAVRNAVAGILGSRSDSSVNEQSTVAVQETQGQQLTQPTPAATASAVPWVNPPPATWPQPSPSRSSPSAPPAVVPTPEALPARGCASSAPSDLGLVAVSGRPSTLPTTQTTGWMGAGLSALSLFNGPLTVTTPGAVIDGKLIRGALVIDAPNVTITRSRIEAPTGNFALYETADGCGLTLDHVEITAVAGAHPDRAVHPAPNLVMNHVFIHGTQRGVSAADGMVLVNSYVDDFDNPSANHASAIGSSGNVHNVVISNSVLGCGTHLCSSAMSLYPEQGPNTNWIITGNRFNGGSYCLYMGFNAAAGESPNTNLNVTGNYFGTEYSPNCGVYGPLASWSWSAGNVWSNNRWADPGQPRDGVLVVPGK